MGSELTTERKINPTITDLVFGYCRESHDQLFPQNDSYHGLYTPIVNICLDFYHIAVEWDKENLWEDFIANGDFIEKIKSDDATAVLTEDISTGIYQYRFKIIKYDNSDDREYYDIGFGIISSREFEWNKETLINRAFPNYSTGYAFWASKGVTQYADTQKRYGVKCDLNDIVTMTINLNNHTLQYKVNDTDYGIAFNNIPATKYKIALYLYEKTSKIQLLK